MTGQGYFSELEGCWLSPEDEYESDTEASLRAVIRALKSKGEKRDALYDAVERLLFEYSSLVRHGWALHDGRKIEWFIYDSPSKRGHVLISFSDRNEWCDDYYSDQVPSWLLITILRKLQRIKPLGDQKADETIKQVHDLDAEYEKLTQKPPKLNVLPHRSGDV